MNFLPLQTLLPVAPAATGTPVAAVLPPALLAVLPTPAGAVVPGRPSTPPTFDRALQQLLAANGLAPVADPTTATLPQAVPAGVDAAPLEPGSEAEAHGAVPRFDPALASLVPPANMAMAQAAQAEGPDAPTVPAAALSPAPVALAAAAAGAAAGSASRAAAPTPTALAGKAAPSAPLTAPAAMPADAAPVLLQDRPASTTAPTLPSSTQTIATDQPPDVAAPARAGEAAPQGRASSLLQALGERIAVQIDRGSERVVIRLDPPNRGQIEIHIRQDASGATQVQLSASHGDVVRQLHAIGDSLRQELAQRQGGDVSVQIAQHSRDADGRPRQDREDQPQQQPGRALDEQAQQAADGTRFALASERP